MLFQDATQVSEYWCLGEVPPPILVFAAGYDYWVCWVEASITAG